METLVFATNNQHKLDEVRAILADKFVVKSLSEIGCDADIPETGTTFSANALQKAEYIKEHYGYDCFADDSGLEVESLNMEPGVYSARYAKMNGREPLPTKDEANMDLLLERIAGKENRAAQFRTSIALIYKGGTHYFDGIVKGRIIDEKRGSEGFGYDPIFIPEGYDQTFAELGADIKNGISHRARAVRLLSEFFEKQK